MRDVDDQNSGEKKSVDGRKRVKAGIVLVRK